MQDGKTRTVAQQHYNNDSSSINTATGTIATIGKAISNTTLSIVDPVTLQHVPYGCIGELVVSGTSVAIGYWQYSTTGVADINNSADGKNVDDNKFINCDTTVALGLGTGRSYKTGTNNCPQKSYKCILMWASAMQ